MNGDIPDLVPARMVNEFVYCPRLFYLEWVESLFAANADTAEGDWQHRAVDRVQGNVAAPEWSDGPRRATSVKLSSERRGLIGVIDVLETDGDEVVPVDTKKGSPPTHAPAWGPEMVQLCVQAIMLRDNGYRCSRGEIYFAETRERRMVEFDEDLVAGTLRVLEELRTVAAQPTPPPPLVDSSKCPRCSLVGICLPDELNALEDRTSRPPRRLMPRDEATQPMYVTEQGARVGVRDGRVKVTKGDDVVAEARLIDVSQINLLGNAQISAQALRTFFRREIPVMWFSYGGWFSGVAEGLPGKNVELRRRQAAIAYQAGLPIAREMVVGKIKNARTLLMRNAKPRPDSAIHDLKLLAGRAATAESVESLLGFEGAAARSYFGQFSAMLRADLGFDFSKRSRRPPLDPTNALLSFVYGLLVKDLTATVLGVGLDPYLGVYHKPRFGRPAMALDVAEEFRPLVADSTVITLINNGEIRRSDFTIRHLGVALNSRGRRAVIRAYERRLNSEVTHPTFGYKITYRRALEVQSRLLAAHLMREVDGYTAMVTR
ncbi:MAG: CRISPR-associated endonuclease Cas1 [Propioniciclava sp.]